MEDRRKRLQIQALLNLDFSPSHGPLCVTRLEIREYVEAHGLPERAGRGADISYERVGQNWKVDYYEKNCNVGCKTFSDQAAALEAILDDALPEYIRLNPRQLVTMNPRPLPHESLSLNMADYVLKSWSDSVTKYTDRVLSGQHHGALIGQFRGLTRYLSELAVARYFRAGAAAEDTLNLIDRAALASLNLFKLIDRNTVTVQFKWEGETLTAPAFESVNTLLTSDLSTALLLARISGNADYMRTLTAFEIGVYEPHMPPDSVSVLHRQYMQCLFSDADAKAAQLREILTPHIQNANNPDIVFGTTNQRVLFSLLENDAKQLSSAIEQHLVAHRELFDSDRNNNRGNILGLMSFRMLAFTIEAHRRNIDVRVISPYVPDDLLEVALARL